MSKAELKNTLPLAEVFFSIQGEGPSIGTLALFIRTSHCNLSCPGYPCDTLEVWEKVWMRLTPQQLVDYCACNGWINKVRKGAHIVLTGGEPTLWQPKLALFLQRVREYTKTIPYVEIETNGTILPDPKLTYSINQFNISPKLTNSGNTFKKRFKLNVVAEWINLTWSTYRTYCLKFVVSTIQDVDEVNGYLCQLREIIEVPNSNVWLMPRAGSKIELEEKSEWITKICKNEGFNFSTRLHLSIWDKATGV